MAASDAVFVDSSAWIALLNADDRFHQLAAELFTAFRAARRPLVCTDWVFAETGNGLARTARRLQFIETVERFRRSRHCRWIHIDEDAFQRALKLYSLKDKQWGLVDCASFATMREEGIQEAATSDHHFEQAGFRCLLPTG
jgi:predicted nucleic acid-binding protein